MTDLPNKPRRVWLRSFYGFGPEDDGYIGWSEEGPRDRMLGLVEDGDLFMIYGAVSAETEKSQRNRVVGFLQVEARAIRDIDKASSAGMQRKRTKGWGDKWTYAIPVVRAWRVDESILLERIAPKTYRPEAGQAIAVWNPPLLPEEIDLALKIKVTEVSVFGDAPPRATAATLFKSPTFPRADESSNPMRRSATAATFRAVLATHIKTRMKGSRRRHSRREVGADGVGVPPALRRNSVWTGPGDIRERDSRAASAPSRPGP